MENQKLIEAEIIIKGNYNADFGTRRSDATYDRVSVKIKASTIEEAIQLLDKVTEKVSKL